MSSIALATAWRPRGEFVRFQKLLPLLQQAYTGLVITLPPDAELKLRDALQDLPGVSALVTKTWTAGRYQALIACLETSADYIHYADFDRLLRWVETLPEEWRTMLAKMPGCDCLIIGRTAGAYATHPQALVQTEALSNRVVSFLLNRQLDVSAGSKGFSRQAATFLAGHCYPARALGADGEWPVLLHRAGFRIDYTEVNGLDWESADRFQDQAAGWESQRQAAQAYDADLDNWRHRLHVAEEIIESALDAAWRSIEPVVVEN